MTEPAMTRTVDGNWNATVAGAQGATVEQLVELVVEKAAGVLPAGATIRRVTVTPESGGALRVDGRFTQGQRAGSFWGHFYWMRGSSKFRGRIQESIEEHQTLERQNLDWPGLWDILDAPAESPVRRWTQEVLDWPSGTEDLSLVPASEAFYEAHAFLGPDMVPILRNADGDQLCVQLAFERCDPLCLTIQRRDWLEVMPVASSLTHALAVAWLESDPEEHSAARAWFSRRLALGEGGSEFAVEHALTRDPWSRAYLLRRTLDERYVERLAQGDVARAEATHNLARLGELPENVRRTLAWVNLVEGATWEILGERSRAISKYTAGCMCRPGSGDPGRRCLLALAELDALASVEPQVAKVARVAAQHGAHSRELCEAFVGLAEESALRGLWTEAMRWGYAAAFEFAGSYEQPRHVFAALSSICEAAGYVHVGKVLAARAQGYNATPG